jgi:ketosteroid isomerase-like protein
MSEDDSVRPPFGAGAVPEASQAVLVPPAELPGPVVAYFAALNDEDWSAMADLWTEDAELRAVGSRPRNGRDQVLSYFPTLFDPWRLHSEGPTRALVAGPLVMTEVGFTGTTQAGKELAFEAVDVFDLRDNQIRRLTTWYDLAWLRKQI